MTVVETLEAARLDAESFRRWQEKEREEREPESMPKLLGGLQRMMVDIGSKAPTWAAFDEFWGAFPHPIREDHPTFAPLKWAANRVWDEEKLDLAMVLERILEPLGTLNASGLPMDGYQYLEERRWARPWTPEVAQARERAMMSLLEADAAKVDAVARVLFEAGPVSLSGLEVPPGGAPVSMTAREERPVRPDLPPAPQKRSAGGVQRPIPEDEPYVPEWEKRAPGTDSEKRQGKVDGSRLFSAGSAPLTKGSIEYVFRGGQVRKRQSSARRRSKRHWYSRNAKREAGKSRERRAKNRPATLEKRRRKEWEERKRPKPRWRRLSESDWAPLKREYVVSRAQGGEPTTFRLLSLKYGVSPRAIQARSSRDGGWALRVRT